MSEQDRAARAQYYREWRAAHPEYRARQNALRNERRRTKGRDRTAEYASRKSRAVVLPPATAPHSGHPLFDQAKAIVGPRHSSLVSLYDPLHDDLIAVAVLALLQGEDAHEAVRAYGARERSYGRVTCPLLEAA